MIGNEPAEISANFMLMLLVNCVAGAARAVIVLNRVKETISSRVIHTFSCMVYSICSFAAAGV